MLQPFRGGDAGGTPTGVSRVSPTTVRVASDDGTSKDLPLAAETQNVSGLARVSPSTVRVALSDGRTQDKPAPGGSGWRLTDPGVSLANPKLRLDGSVLP